MKRALISVYSKTGILELVRELVKYNYEIISTSGTAKLLSDNGVKITTVEELTSSPEILNGRVKTLHPLVFAGLLADKHNSEHLMQADKFGIKLFDLLVVNLYPFADTINKKDCTMPEAIEQIDIGGVSLIRAAAKNYNSVSVLVDPSQYNEYLDLISKGEVTEESNLKLAQRAFLYIKDYDECIADYFSEKAGSGKDSGFSIHLELSKELRYGENPHQKARLFYNEGHSFYDIFQQLHGKELSYINILDIDAAYNLMSEFDDPACAVIKHTNPSGVAVSSNITEAYLKALACDNVSRFGGIIIVNRKMDLLTAQEIDKIKSDIVIAPDYDNDTLEFLFKKKNRAIIKYNRALEGKSKKLYSVAGGLLVQDTDDMILIEQDIKYVTERKPTEAEMADLIFAMKVCKHTKSNSVVYVKNLQTVGIGGGQPSRVDSSHLAVEKARRFGMELENCSVASDAFFPFADGVEEAAKAGARSVIQPGGSIRDEEVIKTANEYGMAMIFTGFRHFRH
jgi:phosphoribosylaminoimidazolecarboxamide formyltransferase/IMP cyclohydrolase